MGRMLTGTEYYYDTFGRRLWKYISGTRTYFFYANERLVAEYNTAGNEQASYGYRPDATWTTDPLWLKRDGEYYFYQNDHLGRGTTGIAHKKGIVGSLLVESPSRSYRHRIGERHG